MDIGNRTEMFVDNKLIEEKVNCVLKLNTPVRREKVLVFDRPWESVTSGYVTVIVHDGLVWMYYRGITESRKDESDALTCLAVSSDGINFTKPGLGICDFHGSKKNNIILKHFPECHNFTPFPDKNPAVDKNMVFKAVGGHEYTGVNKGKLYGLASPDGINWQRISDEPMITEGMFDSQNAAFFDPNTGKYRCYTRYFDNTGLDNPKPYEGFRAIESFESSDFTNWTPLGPNRYERGVDEHLYTNATVCCPGAEHHYLSFPKRFFPDRTRDFYTDEKGLSDAVFMSSRNGVDWDRTFMEAWVRPGLNRKNWVNRNNMPALGIVDSGSEEFSMYISENYKTEGACIRRLSIRKHGFASVHAAYDGGNFTTKPLTFKGGRLYLNYSTSGAGHIKVKMLDDKGSLLTQTDLIYGDEIMGGIDFDDSIAPFEGKPVQLLFELADADIYAMKFEDMNYEL